MPKEESAKGLESLDQEEADKEQSQAEGQKPKKSVDQLLAEYKAENERKGKELSETKQSLEALKTRLDELAEKKEEEGRLTLSEQDEVAQLKARIRAIRGDANSRPWLELIKEDSEGTAKKVAKDTIFQYDYLQAFKLVKTTAKTLSVDAKEFEAEIASILKGGRWMTDEKGRELLPTERVENAIDEYMSLADLRKKSKAEANPAEGEGRQHRGGGSSKEAIREAMSKGETRDILAAIAAKQEK